MCYNTSDMKRKFFAILLAYFLIFIPNCWAMNSSNYQIDWDSLNSGGDDTSSSANYSIQDTLGQITSGESSSTNYQSFAGYRLPEGVDTILVFHVYAEDENTQTAVANSGFSSSGKTVQVADASGYSVDDYVGVVENKGGDQEVAVGKITQVNANTITVDFWEGDNATMETIDGSDDYAYVLSTNEIDLGQLSVGQVSTGISMIEVTTNANNGYTSTVKENYNLALQEGGFDIDDVVDNDVDASTEEYGIETIGQDAQGSNDWAITSVNQTVASDSLEVANRRTLISYKASAGAQSTAGAYGHTVSYYCTANF